jgi:hypothetical protein
MLEQKSVISAMSADKQKIITLRQLGDPTPFDALAEKLQKTPPVSNRRCAIHFTSGSYCPVHPNHLKLFDIAARFLSEQCQIDVFVGYLIPSPDRVVVRKIGGDAISFVHRFQMLSLACKEHNTEPNTLHLIAKALESLQRSFVKAPDLRYYFEQFLKEIFPEEKLEVFCLWK